VSTLSGKSAGDGSMCASTRNLPRYRTMAARGNGACDAAIDEHEEAGGNVASEAREVETFRC